MVETTQVLLSQDAKRILKKLQDTMKKDHKLDPTLVGDTLAAMIIAIGTIGWTGTEPDLITARNLLGLLSNNKQLYTTVKKILDSYEKIENLLTNATLQLHINDNKDAANTINEILTIMDEFFTAAEKIPSYNELILPPLQARLNQTLTTLMNNAKNNSSKTPSSLSSEKAKQYTQKLQGANKTIAQKQKSVPAPSTSTPASTPTPSTPPTSAQPKSQPKSSWQWFWGTPAATAKPAATAPEATATAATAASTDSIIKQNLNLLLGELQDSEINAYKNLLSNSETIKTKIIDDQKQLKRTTLIGQAQAKQTTDPKKSRTKMLRLTKYGSKKFIDKVIGAISNMQDLNDKTKINDIMKSIEDGDIDKAKTDIASIKMDDILKFPSLVRQFLYTFMVAEDGGATDDDKNKYKSLSMLIRRLNKLIGDIPPEMQFEKLKTQVDTMDQAIKNIVETEQQKFNQQDFKTKLQQKQKQKQFGDTKPVLKSLADRIKTKAAQAASVNTAKDAKFTKNLQDLFKLYEIQDSAKMKITQQLNKTDADDNVKAVKSKLQTMDTLSVPELSELLNKIPDTLTTVPELITLRTKIKTKAIETNLKKLLTLFGESDSNKLTFDEIKTQLQTNKDKLQKLKTSFQTSNIDISKLLQLLNAIPADITTAPKLKELKGLDDLSKDQTKLKQRFEKNEIGKSTSFPDTYYIQKNLKENYTKIRQAFGNDVVAFRDFLKMYGEATDQDRRSILKMLIDISTTKKEPKDFPGINKDIRKLLIADVVKKLKGTKLAKDNTLTKLVKDIAVTSLFKKKKSTGK